MTRASLCAVIDDVDCDYLLPTTIFTLSDMRHNKGYGSANASTEKIASRFMQAVAISFMSNSTKVDFYNALKIFHAMDSTRKIKDRNHSKDWETLTKIVKSLEIKINTNNLNAIIITMLEDFGGISRLVAGEALTQNKKVKGNVDKKLAELFGSG